MSPPDELACPWCSYASVDREDVRTHFMVDHRKSDLAAFVAERLEDRRADLETPDPPRP